MVALSARSGVGRCTLAGVALSSVVQLPTPLVTTTSSLSHALLVVAVFFIGAELRRTTLAKVRGRALIFALSLWIGVVGTTLAAVTLLGTWFLLRRSMARA